MSTAAACKLHTTMEAAARIGCPHHALIRAYRLGRLPEPARLGITRALTDEDVERARRLLGRPEPQE